MKNEVMQSIVEGINQKIIKHCSDCEFWEGTCTKKVAIRICKKEKIKVKKEV